MAPILMHRRRCRGEWQEKRRRLDNVAQEERGEETGGGSWDNKEAGGGWEPQEGEEEGGGEWNFEEKGGELRESSTLGGRGEAEAEAGRGGHFEEERERGNSEETGGGEHIEEKGRRGNSEAA